MRSWHVTSNGFQIVHSSCIHELPCPSESVTLCMMGSGSWEHWV